MGICGSTSIKRGAASESGEESKSAFLKSYSIDAKGELGTGAFSKVVRGTKRTADGGEGVPVAVKCISRTAELKQEDIDSLHEEVEVLKSIEHPCVIKLFDFFEEKKMFYMVIELMEGGELFERIVKKTFYNEKEARDLTRILLDALAYLHHKGIAHRDLKPENLLLKSNFNDFDIKIADFGKNSSMNNLTSP